ncbi:MAG: aldehyde dehydrogenase family protein [Parasporobacterium sp.]|nr:aldehyde dehydrogenase family protein [Parasporobacterium sp.]
MEQKLFINGQWVETTSGTIVDDVNPADGTTVARVHLAGADETYAAIEAASGAFPQWKDLLAMDREVFFYRAAEHLAANQFRYAQMLIEDSGSCFMKAMDEIGQCVSICRAAGGECRKINGEILQEDQPGQVSTFIRQPLGVIAGISPFNYPVLLAITKVMLALAAGNTFILKPSSDVPLAGLIIAQTCEAAGFPAGVFNLLIGPGETIGDILTEDPRVKMLTFTGSTVVGKKLAVKCAANGKRITLEMGGKNPMIVLKDFDVDQAVSIGAFGAFFHQGQICMATSRIIVEEPLYEAFCGAFAEKAKTIKMGDPHKEDTIIGPLIHEKQCEFIDSLIRDAVEKGAKVLTGGTHEGSFYAPTVISDVTEEMDIFYQECFGPVAVICRAADAEHALALCNHNQYGLSGALLTNDLSLAMSMAPRMESGMVHVNDSTVMGSRQAPFGGVKDSGMGREGSRFSIEEFTELKWITYQLTRGGYPTDL